MKRSSLTPQKARELGDLIRRLRIEQGLALRRLEAMSSINISTLVSLERGHLFRPQINTLQAIAQALGLPISDLLTVAGWLPADELPDLQFYLRAKYRNLNDAAIADLERYAQKLSQKSSPGPIDDEDETPE